MNSQKSVHPCGRREHLIYDTAPVFSGGSSLRAQGTHSHGRIQRMRYRRFIPAGAGNTLHALQLVSVKRGSSLRAQGTRNMPDANALYGSSLRAQGTL